MADPYRFGRFSLDLAAGQFLADGEPLHLQPKAFELLALFCANAGTLFTREELMQRLWPDVFVTDQSLNQLIRRIRRALGDDPQNPQFLQTIPKRGYRFVADVRTDDLKITPAPSPAASGDRFCGREEELTELCGAVQQAALVTVLGLGGMGKTRLVQELARKVSGSFEGIRQVSLREARSLDDLIFSVADALGVRLGSAATESAIDALGAALAEMGRCLVILDNFEHQVALAPPTLGRWMLAAPECRLLVTSRVPLQLRGERVLQLGGLQLEDGCALLADRAAALGAEVAPSELALLVKALDASPLALELAAPRLAVLSPQELLDRLDQRFKLLRDPGGGTSLRAVLEGSWELLSPSHREALAVLSLFRGTFDLAAAEAALEPLDIFAVDALQVLRSASWLRVLRQSGRTSYQLPETVRVFCRSHLTPERERSVLDRLAAWLLEESSEMDALARRYDMLRTVLDEGSEVAPVVRARLALTFYELARNRGPIAVAERVMANALTDDLPVEIWIDLACSRANAMRHIGRHHDSISLLREAALRANETGDIKRRCGALGGLVFALRAYGKGLEAREIAKEVAAAAEELGDPVRIAHACNVLGVTQHGEEAVATFQAGIDVSMGLVDSGQLRSSLALNLATFLHNMGRRDEALPRYLDAIASGKSEDNPRRLGIARGNLGNLLAELERYDESRQAIGDTIRLFRRHGYTTLAVNFQLNLASVELQAAQPRACEDIVRKLAAEATNPMVQARSGALLAGAAWIDGRVDEAAIRIDQSMAVARAEAPRLLRLHLLVAGAVEADRDHPRASARHLDEVRQLLAALPNRQHFLLTLADAHLALSMARAGDSEQLEVAERTWAEIHEAGPPEPGWPDGAPPDVVRHASMRWATFALQNALRRTRERAP